METLIFHSMTVGIEKEMGVENNECEQCGKQEGNT